jgi:phosphatidylserine decarboxylase
VRIDPSGWPFIGGAGALAVITAAFFNAAVGLGFLILAAIFLFFFRDPNRIVTQARDAVLSPADGRVLIAGPPTVRDFPSESWRQVSIFLSPLDVHVNRIPVAGRVTKVRYHPGRFLPAYRADAGDLNEYTEIWIDHGGQPVVIRQVVGVLARRVVCRTSEGAEVAAGERFGVMKFGSRMDIFVPTDARITVKVGDRVVGGVTVIAIMGQS